MTSPGLGVTTGVTGQTWRATITAWGDIEPWQNAARSWRWFVAADDRWHVPSDEPAVRQRRIDGTPVTETRLRVPDGDAVQRVWSVADSGGLTIIEIENDSPRPFAVAVTGERLLTERPPADVPIQGIELPGDAIVLPVGHRSSVRVAMSHSPVHRRHRTLPPGLPPPSSVVNGWTTMCARASRLALPSAGLVDDVTAARCDLMLEGPTVDDPLGFLFDVAQLSRLGHDRSDWLAEIVEPVAEIARRPCAEVDDALDGVERLAAKVGDDRAANDLASVRTRRAADGIGRSHYPTIRSLPSIDAAGSRGAFVDGVERFCVSAGDVLPGGLPASWHGSNFEVHDLPTSIRSTLSYAVRWHGARPAVLWEQRGDPVVLAASAVDAGWTTDAQRGEWLWPPQPASVASPTRVDPPSRVIE